jgi:hypothetical protein
MVTFEAVVTDARHATGCVRAVPDLIDDDIDTAGPLPADAGLPAGADVPLTGEPELQPAPATASAQATAAPARDRTFRRGPGATRVPAARAARTLAPCIALPLCLGQSKHKNSDEPLTRVLSGQTAVVLAHVPDDGMPDSRPARRARAARVGDSPAWWRLRPVLERELRPAGRVRAGTEAGTDGQ